MKNGLLSCAYFTAAQLHHSQAYLDIESECVILSLFV